MKTYLHVYNFDPLKPHFDKVKLGFNGLYIVFLITAQKHRLWVPIRIALPLDQPVRIKYITKTCLYDFDPLKPHFYTVNLGFTGVYIIFLISAQKYRLWVLIRPASSRWL